MPIRSPRRLYEIETITENLDDNPDAIDTAPGQNPRMVGVFKGNGLNTGSQYRRNLGGFKVASYTLIAKTFFVINEQYYDNVNGILVEATKKFRTMSIGLPKGHSVHEFITFLGGADNFENILALRTPAGRRIDLYDPS